MDSENGAEGLPHVGRAVSTTTRITASPTAAHPETDDSGVPSRTSSLAVAGLVRMKGLGRHLRSTMERLLQALILKPRTADRRKDDVACKAAKLDLARSPAHRRPRLRKGGVLTLSVPLRSAAQLGRIKSRSIRSRERRPSYCRARAVRLRYRHRSYCRSHRESGASDDVEPSPRPCRRCTHTGRRALEGRTKPWIGCVCSLVSPSMRSMLGPTAHRCTLKPWSRHACPAPGRTRRLRLGQVVEAV